MMERVKGQGSRDKRQNYKLKFKSLILLTLALSFYLFTFDFCISYAEESLTSSQLIEVATTLDGKKVVYRGEVVTAILNRGEFSWINLNDGYNAIGVWCRKTDCDSINFIGDYKCKGDILEVSGIFHRACPAHNGELDIHSDSIKIIKRGFSVKDRVERHKLDIAIIVFLSILLLMVIFRKRL